MKYFANQQGQYLGAFDGVEPPAGAVEVPKAPKTARDKWDGQKWIDAQALPPVSVSMRQARLALHGAGLLPDVQNAIDGLTEPDRTQAAIEWEYASTVEREGPITQMLAGAMGLTSSELDQLFETAAGL